MPRRAPSPRPGPVSGRDRPRAAPRPSSRVAGARRVGVLAALPEEVRPVRDRLEDVETDRREVDGRDAALTLARGRMDGAVVTLAVTGDGRRRARSGARAFLRSADVDRLLVLGVAGALSPDLAPGSVVVSRRVWLGTRRLTPGREAVERARRRSGAVPGSVVTVEDLLLSPGEKRAAWDRLREEEPDAGPAVADLESGHYAAVAEEEGVDWLVLRSVSDDASESLPSYLNRCRDDGGALRRGSVLLRALLRPTSIGQLLRIRRRVSRSARALATGLQRIVAGGSR